MSMSRELLSKHHRKVIDYLFQQRRNRWVPCANPETIKALIHWTRVIDNWERGEVFFEGMSQPIVTLKNNPSPK